MPSIEETIDDQVKQELAHHHIQYFYKNRCHQ